MISTWRTFKKIALAVLITGSASSAVFGMDGVVTGFSQAEMERLLAVFSQDEIQRFLADQNRMKFLVSSLSGDAQAVRTLLQSLPSEKREAFILTSLAGGFTALHAAIFRKRIEVVRAIFDFLSEDAKFSLMMALCPGGCMVLYLVVVDGKSAEMIELLLSSVSVEHRLALLKGRKFPEEMDVLFMAAGFSAEMTALLLNYVPMELRFELLSTPQAGGLNCLHAAVRLNKIESVPVIINSLPAAQRLPYIMIKDSDGRTALDIAVADGYTAIANILIGYCGR